MTNVRIKLLDFKYQIDFIVADDQLEKARTLDDAGRYVTLPLMHTEKTGVEAAEEMFDLTNNPNREAERYELYGNGRSISVGDIIEVDGVNYVCLGMGWAIL